ncbi:MAG TPA: DUF3147 family protein [Syntrophorhabdaceae bacterium]|jgi:F0F1-type ATP synthase assembly protein I
MALLIKAVLSLLIIFGATAIAGKFPSTGGLIAVMPLTGAIVLLWVHIESKGNTAIMQAFTKGALWGILPSIIFFLVAFICSRRGCTLAKTLGASFAAWAIAAFAHQALVR